MVGCIGIGRKKGRRGRGRRWNGDTKKRPKGEGGGRGGGSKTAEDENEFQFAAPKSDRMAVGRPNGRTDGLHITRPPFRRDLHILQRIAETGGREGRREEEREACKIVKTVPTEEKERREGSVCRLRSRRRRRGRSCVVLFKLGLRKKKK